MNKNALAGVLGVLLALSIGGNAWLFMKSNQNKKSAKDIADVAILRDSLQKETFRLDSLQNLLLSTQTDHQKMATRVDELEGSATELQNKLAYYKNLVAQGGAALQGASSGGGSRKMSEIKADLEARLKEIEELNAQIAVLIKERDEARGERDGAVSAKTALETENSGLKNKVSIGAMPQYGSLHTIGQTSKGSSTVEGYKAKGLKKFKVSFDILENPLVPENTDIKEEVTIRIISPDGSVFSKDNSKMEDVEKVYSLKQVISSNGDRKHVDWVYPSSGDLNMKVQKGRYTAELWARGKLQQKNIFDLM